MALINKKRRFSPREERIIHESELFGINKKRRFTSPRQRSIDEFELFNKIGEGAYGVVYRARDKKTGEIVAVKKVKPDGKELPETNILARLNHPSIVDLKHVITGGSGSDSGSVFLVMEYAENDIRSLLKTMRHPFSQSEVKYLMQELLQGVDHLHRNQILHRDLKTSNLLFNNRGELKICDFGLACRVNNDMVMHTETVVTLWYRAPELLLGVEEYSAAVDMWSVGCIMAELLLRQPLFYGETESDQFTKIFKILGSPSEAIWPGFSKLKGAKIACLARNQRTSLLRQRFQAMSDTGSALLSNAGVDLLKRLLTYDPRKRMTAEEALNHSWFREVPRPKSRDFMPTYPPKLAMRW